MIGAADSKDGRALIRFQLVAGKGGAGKTTVAAARALRLAHDGHDVLAVSTDPAHSLGDALDMTLSSTPRPAPLPETVTGRLRALHLDADGALDRWLAARRRALRRLAEEGTHVAGEGIDSWLDVSFVGVDELVALLEVARLAAELEPTIVVVDTAPTGHFLRLCEMPRTLGCLAAVLQDMHAGAARGNAAGGRAVGDEPSDALVPAPATVVTAPGTPRTLHVDRLIHEVSSQAAALKVLLRDWSRTRVTWVTLPERVAYEEAKHATAALEADGIDVDEIVVNGVLADADGACPVCVGRAASQRPVLDKLRRRYPEKTLTLLPLVDEEPRGAAALGRFGEPQKPNGRLEAPPRTPTMPPTSLTPAPLPMQLAARLVERPRRLVLVTGKGGAGKTTVAAAIALAASQASPERRVLLLSADPAHALGDVLDTPLGDDEREVPGSALRAREIDARRAFAELRSRYRKNIDELFAHGPQGNDDQRADDRAVLRDLVDLSPPGIDELFALAAAVGAVAPRGMARARADLVVVDMPATGHALRLLHMPETARDWVHALWGILEKHEGHALAAVGEDLGSRAAALDELVALLHDWQATAVVTVAGPGALAAAETARLLRVLDVAHIAAADVVLNARAQGRCVRCRRRAAAEEQALQPLLPALAGRRVVEVPLAPAAPLGVKALSGWLETWRARR